RFNAGQKAMFWSVVLGGAALSVTGIILLFPFSLTDINGMQIGQYVHATVGVILIAIMIAHIYIGTIGVQGAFDAMESRKVDPAWARLDHRAGVEEQQGMASGDSQVGGGTRATPAE